MRILVLCAMLSGVARADAASDRIDAMPALQRILASTALCIAAVDRASAVEELATEKRYERESGVVRLAQRNALRSRLEMADRESMASRQLLKKIASAPLKCSDGNVYGLSLCARGEHYDWCTSDYAIAMTHWLFNNELLQADE
jgi:hypothetical protein